jgi:hypothetical protein
VLPVAVAAIGGPAVMPIGAGWHRGFRGEARVRDDRRITRADIAHSSRIAGRPRVPWTAAGIAPVPVFSGPRQRPQRPGRATEDITAPPDARCPGIAARAGFRGEDWTV